MSVKSGRDEYVVVNLKLRQRAARFRRERQVIIILCLYCNLQ